MLLLPPLRASRRLADAGYLLRITKKVSAERYGAEKKVKKDMLGSFVNHGLTEEEAESETLIQVFVFLPTPTKDGAHLCG